jgi:hypothetical protein
MFRYTICIFSLFLSVLTAGFSFAQERQRLGEVPTSLIDEASGIAASRKNQDIVWVHNDSGDRHRIFAVDRTGNVKKIFVLPGAQARDWEDIAIGPGPVAGEDYLYVGDIGDNARKHPFKIIYRFLEPSINASIGRVDAIRFRYPDGSYNAETLMVDPVTRDILVVTKESKSAQVYRLPYPQSTEEIITLQPVATLDLDLALSGDISADAQKILIKTREKIYYWKRARADEPLTDVFKRAPAFLPYIEEYLEEGACFDPSGQGYYTIGEQYKKRPVYLYYYPLG